MSTLTSELIKDRINDLEPSYREFIVNGSLAEIAQNFITAQNFDEDTGIIFENGLVLFMIFFLSQETFTNYLISDCLLERHDATLLAEAVKLALPSEIRNAFEVTQKAIDDEEARAAAREGDHSPVEEASHLPNEGTETSQVPLPPTPQVAEAVEDNVYRSTQEDIINNK